MKVKFIGATKHVTGSCSWLKYPQTGSQFLVDCGMHQGDGVEKLNSNEFPFDPAEIDFVLLTHAHLDHCGLIPKLYKEGFTGKVYTTAATAKLTKLILKDSAKISKMNGQSLYSEGDVDRVVFQCVDDYPGFTWGKQIPLTKGVMANFLMSSHILGAASISVSWSESPDVFDTATTKTMVFSGDIGNNTDECSYLPLLKANKYPFPATDYMLVESTYGGRTREAQYKCRDTRLAELDRVISDTVDQKHGKVVIPAFSIHRSQEILMDLAAWLVRRDKAYQESGADGESRTINILCQSTMIAMSCQVYFEELERKMETPKGIKNQYLSKTIEDDLGYHGEFSDAIKFLFNTVDYEGSGKSPKSHLKIGCGVINVAAKMPASIDKYDIIVSSSGMCDAGPICQYLDKLEGDSKSSIIMTGYQAPGTRGQRLVENQEVDLRSNSAEVFNFSSYYSGHASQEVLLDYVFRLNGYVNDKTDAMVFINHGNENSKNCLKSAIEDQASIADPKQRSITAVEIANGEKWFDLDTGQYDDCAEDVEHNSHSLGDLYDEISAMKRLLRQLVLSNEQIVELMQSKLKKTKVRLQ